ncbi:hypothetical protein AK812_SmicGene3424 [Symbiodinium microadriaticum]|uniref:Uncharacterized protein n=1 Tax=Symbiodinium microadriaticum TaxID=2951 RepID=A0A1Q9EZ17_SYMMI|nr:hypothetical protein AK812_SmicGene3424 [Symbiodinium microadriaticum]
MLICPTSISLASFKVWIGGSAVFAAMVIFLPTPVRIGPLDKFIHARVDTFLLCYDAGKGSDLVFWQNVLQAPDEFSDRIGTPLQGPGPCYQPPSTLATAWPAEVLVNFPLLAANWLAVEASGCKGAQDEAELEAASSVILVGLVLLGLMCAYFLLIDARLHFIRSSSVCRRRQQLRPSDDAADEVGSSICLGRGGSKSCFAYRDVKLGAGWQLFCVGSYTKTKGGEGYCPTEIIIIIIIKASQGVEDGVQKVKDTSEIESDVSTCVVSDFFTDSEKSGGRRLSLFSHGAVLPTAVCLSKAAIGAGILTMASHAAEVGIVFQAVALIGAAVLSLASIRFIATACIATGCYSYEDLCNELLHPVMALFTGFMNSVN